MSIEVHHSELTPCDWCRNASSEVQCGVQCAQEIANRLYQNRAGLKESMGDMSGRRS